MICKVFYSELRFITLIKCDNVQEVYNLLVDLEEHLLQKLQAGVKLSEVYDAGVSYVQKAKPDILDNFTKNWG
jgi:nucleosome binding factor SPN SPT16 subunit